MLSDRFFKHFGWRVKLMALGGGTFYNWDPASKQLITAKPFQLYLMRSGLGAGVFFLLVHAIQIYLKTHTGDGIPDEAFEGDVNSKSKMSPTLLIEYGEVLLVLCVFFLNIVSVQRMDLHMYLINQLIRYNKLLEDMIESGKLVLERDQKIMIKVGEAILYIVFVATILLPIGILGSLMHPVEPTHVLILEWTDVAFKLQWDLLPFIALMLQACYACGTTICMMMMSISMYCVFSVLPLHSLTPIQLDGRIRTKRCRFATRSFGVLEDVEIIHLYRTQQILNVVLNEFYKSVLISYHHVGALAAASCLICFAIGYHDILSEEGIVAYAVVLGSIWAAAALIFIQSRMGGLVVDTSDEFQDKGMKMVGVGTLYHKFCKSCRTFYIQVAWPFYNIHKETFLLFCEQVLDWVLTLLLG